MSAAEAICIVVIVDTATIAATGQQRMKLSPQGIFPREITKLAFLEQSRLCKAATKPWVVVI
jgi:hypothetical protein